MNTPEPCAKCDHCRFDAWGEDEPTNNAYCELSLQMGNLKCPKFKKFKRMIEEMVMINEKMIKEKKE